jgi:hypothetical protein
MKSAPGGRTSGARNRLSVRLMVGKEISQPNHFEIICNENGQSGALRTVLKGTRYSKLRVQAESFSLGRVISLGGNFELRQIIDSKQIQDAPTLVSRYFSCRLKNLWLRT